MIVLSSIKKFYDLTRSNQCLTVYWINCNCCYVKPVSPASPRARERMENIKHDIRENFPDLEYTPRPGNMLRVQVRG